MLTFYKIVSYLVVITGAIHTIMTPVFYSTFSIDTVWFAGTGLSLVFLGLLNLSAINAGISTIFTICIAANIICTIYSIIIVIALREPQSYGALVILIAALISSIWARIKFVKQN